MGGDARSRGVEYLLLSGSGGPQLSPCGQESVGARLQFCCSFGVAFYPRADSSDLKALAVRDRGCAVSGMAAVWRQVLVSVSGLSV